MSACLPINGWIVPVVMMYDVPIGKPQDGQLTTCPTYLPNAVRRWKPKNSLSYGGRGNFTHTGVENEFMCFLMVRIRSKSRITLAWLLKNIQNKSPQTGEFSDVRYYCEMDASVAGWWSKTDQNGWYKLYGLWGDDGNSSTITQLLVIRIDSDYSRYSHGAQIIDIPAASDWKAYPAN